ncbi:MAG: M24 family metallopeptidase, partial [Aquiluna sp.]
MRKRFELKTDDDIRKMRVAGLLTAKALKAVRDAVKPGVTTLELDQIAEQTIRDGGGIPNFQLVPGYYHTICASINSAVV